LEETSFEWDDRKNFENGLKHHVGFEEAQYAFADPRRIILCDVTHSTKNEERYFCVGMIPRGIVTVRFVLRPAGIRIVGAGFWRKGKTIYESENR
jgi:uncharacterized DUF497 family protein